MEDFNTMDGVILGTIRNKTENCQSVNMKVEGNEDYGLETNLIPLETNDDPDEIVTIGENTAAIKNEQISDDPDESGTIGGNTAAIKNEQISDDPDESGTIGENIATIKNEQISDDPDEETAATEMLPQTRKQKPDNIKRNIKTKGVTNPEDEESNSNKFRKVLYKGNIKNHEKKKFTGKLKASKSGKKLIHVKTMRRRTARNKKSQPYQNGEKKVVLEGVQDEHGSTPDNTEEIDEDSGMEMSHGKCEFHVCPVCNKKLSAKSSLKRHRRSASCVDKNKSKDEALKDVSQTGIDEFDFGSAVNLRREVSEAKRTCNICNRVLANLANLKRHTNALHNSERPKLDYKFKCLYEGCPRRFTSPGNRKKHCDAVHLNIRKFLCETCPLMFKTGSALKAHVKTQHSSTQEKVYMFECPQCKRRFSSKFKLQAHETVHTHIKPYQCDVEGCGKVFRLKDTLRKHTKMHMNYKPFVCVTCNQSFTRKLYLDTHQYKHTGIKMFRCLVCDKSFSQKGNLHVHMKSHRDQQHLQYGCKLCEKTFMTKFSLIQHRRIYHGVKGEDSDDQNEEKKDDDAVPVMFYAANT